MLKICEHNRKEKEALRYREEYDVGSYSPVLFNGFLLFWKVTFIYDTQFSIYLFLILECESLYLTASNVTQYSVFKRAVLLGNTLL